jgi:hypothetical protein
MGLPRIVGVGWLFGWVAGFEASPLGREVPSSVALCELCTRFAQRNGKLIPLSTQQTQLGQLGMAIRNGLGNDTIAGHRESGVNYACA